jgi:hypothetical protein
MSLKPGIHGVEQIIEGKAPGMEGKYYEELSEEEKVRLSKYHDLLISLKSLADRWWIYFPGFCACGAFFLPLTINADTAAITTMTTAAIPA